MAKKPKKLGKVTFNISYTIDLNNQDMVNRVKGDIVEDIRGMIHNQDEIMANIKTEIDKNASEADIPSWLQEQEEEEKDET